MNIINAITNKIERRLDFWYYISFLAYIEIPLILFAISEGEAVIALSVLIINMLIILIFAMKNIIVMIKNKQVNKKILIYITSIIYGIIQIVTIFISEEFLVIFILLNSLIPIIMQFVCIYEADNVEQVSKSRIICSIISYIVILVSLVYIAISLGKNVLDYISLKGETDKYLSEFKQNMNAICLKNETDTIMCIPVCKNGKWGYISTKGEEVIECKYDEVTEFFELRYETEIDNTKYSNEIKIAMVREGSEYKIIHTNGDVIASYKNKALPWEKTTKSADYIYNSLQELNYSRNIPDKLDIKINFESPSIGQKYDYPSEGENISLSGNVMLIAEETEDGDKYNLTTMQNNEVISTATNVYYLPEYPYSDGSIPFYNYGDEENSSRKQPIVGWIDREGKKYYVEGDFTILDVSSENIFIRDNMNEEVRIYINGEYNTTVKSAKAIKNGYIIDSGTNMVYMDSKLNNKGGFWNSIDETYIDEDVLIVSKDNSNYYLMNTDGQVISDAYDIIKGYTYYSDEEIKRPRLITSYYDYYTIENTADKLLEEYEPSSKWAEREIYNTDEIEENRNTGIQSLIQEN